jgi:hypothetical protein
VSSVTDLGLILDALIAGLLIATIAYAAVLNRKLGALRDAKSEMEALLAGFTESTERAGSGVESLKQEAGRSGSALQSKVEAARGLVDDLGFLIERGTKLAERLDEGLGAARAKPAPGRASERAPAPRAPAERPAAPAARAGAAEAPGKSTAADTAADKAGVAAGVAAGEADLVAAESELLKALQGMR